MAKPGRVCGPNTRTRQRSQVYFPYLEESPLTPTRLRRRDCEFNCQGVATVRLRRRDCEIISHAVATERLRRRDGDSTVPTVKFFRDSQLFLLIINFIRFNLFKELARRILLFPSRQRRGHDEVWKMLHGILQENHELL